MGGSFGNAEPLVDGTLQRLEARLLGHEPVAIGWDKRCRDHLGRGLEDAGAVVTTSTPLSGSSESFPVPTKGSRIP